MAEQRRPKKIPLSVLTNPGFCLVETQCQKEMGALRPTALGDEEPLFENIFTNTGRRRALGPPPLLPLPLPPLPLLPPVSNNENQKTATDDEEDLARSHRTAIRPRRNGTYFVSASLRGE